MFVEAIRYSLQKVLANKGSDFPFVVLLCWAAQGTAAKAKRGAGQRLPQQRRGLGCEINVDTTGSNPMTGTPYNGLNGKTNGRWETNCGPGGCRDLLRFRHVCDSGCGEVVVGGTHMTRRNNCPCGCEVVEDARMPKSAFSGW